MAATETWWGNVGGPSGAAQRAALLPRLFFDHFADTSVVLHSPDGELAGFLIGFVSPADPTVGYLHFTGVSPQVRRTGVAAALYRWFFVQALARGADTVRCITSPGNHDSIAFHTAIGFTVVDGDTSTGGVAVHTDYDGPGLDRVLFHRFLPRTTGCGE